MTNLIKNPRINMTEVGPRSHANHGESRSVRGARTRACLILDDAGNSCIPSLADLLNTS